MTTYSRDELEAAYGAFAAQQKTQDWNAICDDLYTDDAVYVEHALGTFEGREAIRAWLVPCMEPLVGWEYPTTWVAYGDGIVAFGWDNIMPTPVGDDGTYSFAGVTKIDYAGDNRWCRHEDTYNNEEMKDVLGRWLAAGGKLAGM
jgi:ketosteroid isomerase-like protein